MLDEVLSRIFFSQTAVLIIVTALLLVIAEAGFRVGRFSRKGAPDAGESGSGSARGAVLGLLGLLLGFSFALAAGRYDTRRTLVLDEANSIGTTWLRADLLPENHVQPVKNLLLRYTLSRVEVVEDVKANKRPDPIAEHLKAVENIHGALWDHATAAAREQPSPVTVSFINSLNETIDLHSDRVAAMYNRVPSAVWLLLLIVSSCSAWSNGHANGWLGRRSSFSQFVFPALIAIVITLITDIDRPQAGLIHVSQQPIEDLYNSLNSKQP